MLTHQRLGRVLAIDYGRKRIGVAVSDYDRFIATPLSQIKNDSSQVWQQMDVLIQEYQIKEILMGYPSTADGQRIALHNEIDNFLGCLKNNYSAIELKIIDEAYTSVKAQNILLNLNNQQQTSFKRRKQHKEKLDSVAAAVFLRSFLENPLLAKIWQNPKATQK